MNKKVFSVSDINGYVKNLLEDDYVLRSVYIKGEISNFNHHSSGHMYFTLKDPNGAVSAVMFRGSASSLKFEPEVGMMVIVRASVSLYEKTGKYQVYVYEMEVSGQGTLHQAFEQLKKKLDKEGLFDEIYKKPIPYFPKTIGVITSTRYYVQLQHNITFTICISNIRLSKKMANNSYNVRNKFINSSFRSYDSRI